MSSLKLSCSPIPIIYLGIWMLCVLLLFLFGINSYLAWLTANVVLQEPPKYERVNTSTAHDEARQREMLARPLPVVPPAALQPDKPAAPKAPVQEAAAAPHVRSGRPVIDNPRFGTEQDSFSVSFDLGIEPSGEVSITKQNKVAAWMINLPGRWTMPGKAYIDVDHPLVKTIVVLVNKTRARFKLFYRDPGHELKSPPKVTLTDRGISIVLTD